MDELFVFGERYGWLIFILVFLVGKAWPWLTRTVTTRDTRQHELEMEERKAAHEERDRILGILDGFQTAIQQIHETLVALHTRMEQMTPREEVLDRLVESLHQVGVALAGVVARLEHLEHHAEAADRTLAIIATTVDTVCARQGGRRDRDNGVGDWRTGRPADDERAGEA